MSESVANNSESYSAPSRKYQGYSNSSSESQSGYLGHHSEAVSPSPVSMAKQSVDYNREENIKKARKALKESEDFLLTRQEVIQNHAFVPLIQNCIRSIAVDSEALLLANPSVSTIFSCYEKIHNKLSAEQKEQSINKIIFEGLTQLTANERRNNSALKYW